MTQPPWRRGSGAAIIAAMLVVMLAALILAGAIWREEVQVRRVEAERLADQAAWIERGAVDWTRLILRATGDAAPSVDYPGQVWSMPVAPTRLSDFLSQIGQVRAAEGEATYLSGRIEDLQARFNLRDLAQTPSPGSTLVDPVALAAYTRLLGLLGLDPALAAATAERVRASVAPGNPAVALAGAAVIAAPAPATPTDAPLPLTSLSDLLDVPGYTPDVVARLEPFAMVLPVVTPVNVNTAPAEVLAAVVPGLSLAAAQAAVAARTQAYFRNLADLQNALQGSNVAVANQTDLDVRSHFFVVHGHVKHERAEIDRDTTLYRSGVVPNATRIVSSRDTY